MPNIVIKKFGEATADYLYTILSFFYLTFLLFGMQADRIISSYVGAYVLPFFYFGIILAAAVFSYMAYGVFVARRIWSILLILPILVIVYILQILNDIIIKLRIFPFDASSLLLFGTPFIVLLGIKLMQSKGKADSNYEWLKKSTLSIAKTFAFAVLTVILVAIFFYVYFGTVRELNISYEINGLVGILFHSLLIIVVFGVLSQIMLRDERSQPRNEYVHWVWRNSWRLIITFILICVLSILAAPYVPVDMGGYTSLPFIYFIYLFPSLSNIIIFSKKS